MSRPTGRADMASGASLFDLMISRDGVLVGVIGVFSDTGPKDELCAIAGDEPSGLAAQL